MQTAFEKNEGAALPINILDVLFSVYKDTFDRELVADLVQTLLMYLASFCHMMTNGQAGLSERLTREIAAAIGKNARTQMNDEFRSICDAFFAG